MRRIGILLVLLALTQTAAPEKIPAAGPWPTGNSPVKALAAGAQAASASSQQAETVSCRLLESWTVKELGVRIAIIHQAHKQDGPKLGELLMRRDGATAEFQTPDGQWHAASVFRVGSCFGRGMIVFPASSASLARREIIPVKFAIAEGSLGSRTP